MTQNVLQLKQALQKYLSGILSNERRVTAAVNVLLIVLLASALSQLSWRIFSPDTINNAKPGKSSEAFSNKVEPAARLRTISNLHLFGKTEVIEKTDAPIVAPETRLQLKLNGVFASSNPDRAYAIISDSKNHDLAYKLGNKVAGGAILHAVYADRVILKRDGRLETLRMSVSYDKAEIKTTTKPAAPRQGHSRRTIEAPQKLKQLKDTLLTEPKQFWQQVRVNPVLKDGSVKGYTIEHKDKQLMRSLNLQSGDIITAVNGKPLSDPSSLYGLINQIKEQESFELTIERNGQVQVLQLQM